MTTCEVCGAPLLSKSIPPVLAASGTIEHDIMDDTDEMFYSYKLSFRQAGEKAFYEKMIATLQRQSWKAESSDGVDKGNNVLATIMPKRPTGAGIGGLERATEAITLTNDATLGQAFDDLEALMARAKDLVSLAESFARRLASAPGGTSDDSKARDALRHSSEALGLSTEVVTREIAGDQKIYHYELSRQIAEFLSNGLLKREGGIMPIVDLYALYNRARGNGKIRQNICAY